MENGDFRTFVLLKISDRDKAAAVSMEEEMTARDRAQEEV